MIFLAYILTFLLFIGPVVLAVMGLPIYGFSDNVKEVYLYPSFYILSIAVLIWQFQGELQNQKMKYAKWIIVTTFSWFFIQVFLGREGNKNVLFHSMALPAMYYIMYEKLKDSNINKIKLRNFVIFMFTLNGLMAIFERLTLTVYYPYDLIRKDFDFGLIQDEMIFRSAALLGHPLTNALCMSIIMVFILTSELKLFNKTILYLLGFFSLFCFNARAAIMISAGTYVLYVIGLLFLKDSSLSKRFFQVVLLLLFVVVGVYLLGAGFGGRFEEQGSFSEDNSALARIEVFGIIGEYGVSNFLWGLPYKDVENIAMEVLGMTHVENWFILSTMIVGLVVTTIVVLLFIPVYRNAIFLYDRYTSFLLFVGFVVLASTNNSLATGIPALSIFFACCYVFSHSEDDDVIERDTVSEIES
jgi:hypothetical protein